MAGMKEKFKALPRWKKIILYIFGFLVIMAIIGPPPEKSKEKNEEPKVVEENIDEANSGKWALQDQAPTQTESPKFDGFDYTTLSDGYKIGALKCLSIMTFAGGEEMSADYKVLARDIDQYCGYSNSSDLTEDEQIQMARLNFNGYVINENKNKVQEYGRRCKELMGRATGN